MVGIVPVSSDSPALLSPLPDTGDLPLDSDVIDGEFELLMRRTGLAEGEPGTTVSGFNSSITAARAGSRDLLLP